MISQPVSSSFRDPSGFLYTVNGTLYRQVNECYRANYDQLISSGLYKELIDSGLLVAHEEVPVGAVGGPEAYKTLKPTIVPFISYPYEWCFSQLKDAALATLDIQERALEFGMTLKDSSAYNIQFVDGKPVLIDTLSFELYRDGYPWTPYRQFCQHFLAPLALMGGKDIRLNQLLQIHIDGIPLDLASSILPLRSRFFLSLLLHIHLHARSQKHYADKALDKRAIVPKVSRSSMLGLIGSLKSAVKGMKWRPQGTEWVDYYSDDSYVPEALAHKKSIVGQFLDAIRPGRVWDLGANTGVYSRMAAEKGASVISFDVDPACVELNYLDCTKSEDKRILPLILDLTNPSHRIGWAGEERLSIQDRGPVDMVMALALVHHLAISNNVPLGRIADFLSNICSSLIIEFAPKSDHKVERLLMTREDVFHNYKQADFEEEFSKRFRIRAVERIPESERILYLMVKE